MRSSTLNQLKKLLLIVILASQLALCLHLYRSGWRINTSPIAIEEDIKKIDEKTKVETSILHRPVTGKCLKRGDIDLIVTYTLWGNIMMPVYTISCSIQRPAGQKFQFIPETFFRKHGDEKPIVRFTSSKKERQYTILLLQTSPHPGKDVIQQNEGNPILWLVVNVNGEKLIDGMYKWNEQVYGQEILGYKAPTAEDAEHYFQFILFKQEEPMIIKDLNIHEIQDNLDKFIENKNLVQIATAVFTTGNKPAS